MAKERKSRQRTKWGFLFLTVLVLGSWMGVDVGAEDTEPVAAYPVVHTVTSNSTAVVSKTFTVSADSVNDFYQANYRFTIDAKGGYVAIKEAGGNVLLSSGDVGGFSGNITLGAGKTYIVTAQGVANGGAGLTVSYLERIKSGFNYFLRLYDMDQAKDSGVNNVLSLYLPAVGSNFSVLQQNRMGWGSILNLNTKNDLLVRPYDIPVYYEPKTDRDSSITIVRCDAQGNAGATIFSGGDDVSGKFTILRNQGVLVSMNSGHAHTTVDLQKKNIGGNCQIKLRYRLDETPPNAPVLTVKNLGESGVSMIHGQIHTNGPLVFQWTTPQDNATKLADGTLIGPGGVTRYKLDCYQNNRLIRSEFLSENPAGNSYTADLPEGEYRVQMQAYDLDGNEGPLSNEIGFTVDRSVAPVKLATSGVKLDGDTLRVIWEPVEDISNIKEYQAALTTSQRVPEAAQIGTDETQAVFTGLRLPQIYFVWVRAIDQLGNTGEWAMTGPFSLSTQPVNLAAFPQTALGINNQPLYQVDLFIYSKLAGRYIVERQAEGASTRQTIADLTFEQLAQQDFKIVDCNNFSPHGSYVYYVKQQNGTVTNSYQTATVTLPNLAAGFTVSGPDHQATTTSFTHTIDITPKTDPEGDALKFKVWYRKGQGQPKSSGVYVAGPVTLTFPTEGAWEWWVEVGEFSNNKLIARHPVATAQVLFIRSSTAYLPDGTQVAKDVPRFEDSAPGFGKAVRIEYRASIIPTNPFFVKGVDDWSLVEEEGATAKKESIAGGNFGGKIARITVNRSGYRSGQIRFYKAIGEVTAGAKIACQVRARASSPTNAAVLQCSNDSNPGESFGSQALSLTTEYRTFKLLAVAASASTARIGLELGRVPAGTSVDLDFICCETGKVLPTSPHDGSRSLENLKLSTTGFNAAAGTWEQLVFIDPIVKRKGVTLYNRIFSIPQANGNMGINVYHATAAGVWDLETYNDAGKGSWLSKPISDTVTQVNQWYRFRMTWNAAEAWLRIYEAATGVKVAEAKINNPKIPTAFAPYAYVGNTGLSSFPETLHDDIRVSNIARTDAPDFTKPLPVDASTVAKLNLDGTLEPEYCQPAVRTLTIQSSVTNGVSLPALFETTAGALLQLGAKVTLTNQAVEYRWIPGDGGAELTGEQPVYTYTKLGDYTLTLKVKDSAGQVFTAAAKVQVRNTAAGTVAANETWSGTHLIIGDLVVAPGKTITVQAGTVIYIASGSSLKVEGNLLASDANRGIIIKTEDGSLWQGLIVSGSGMVNLNGVTLEGAKTGIACSGSGESILSNTTIQNCQVGLHAYNGTIKASSCTFQGNQFYGVKEDNGCNPTLTNCQFESNGIQYYDEQLYYLTAAQLNTGSNSGNVFTN